MVTEYTQDAVTMTLRLSYVRSLGVVALALAKAFPTTESWETLRNSEEFVLDMNHFAQVFADIRTSALQAQSDEDFERLITEQYDLAVEAITEFANKYHIPAEDLVQVCMQ